MTTRAAPKAHHAWFSNWIYHPLAAWTGPVKRRKPKAYQRPSVHFTWQCSCCRRWTMDGAWRTSRCNFCDTPRDLARGGVPGPGDSPPITPAAHRWYSRK